MNSARGLEHAWAIAAGSPDPSTKVGAVIVKNGSVVAVGHNAPPRRLRFKPEELLDREWKLRNTVHAELDALMTAGMRALGSVMYVTHHPCSRCAPHIVLAGVSCVVTEISERTLDYRTRWKDDVESARHTLQRGGVILEYYIP